MPTNQALYDVLTSFAETLADRFEVADVLYALSDHTVQVLGATGAGVSLADTDDKLQFVSANSEVAAELERVQQMSRQGPCHDAFKNSTDVVVDDISTHDEWPIYRAEAAELGLHAVMGLSLRVSDRTLGALNVYSDHVREWSPDDIGNARVLANIATGYILHASRLDEALQLNQQLQQALHSRVVIEQAKGILAGEEGISVDAAFDRLRRHARTRNASLRSVAEAVVELGLRPTAPD